MASPCFWWSVRDTTDPGEGMPGPDAGGTRSIGREHPRLWSCPSMGVFDRGRSGSWRFCRHPLDRGLLANTHSPVEIFGGHPCNREGCRRRTRPRDHACCGVGSGFRWAADRGISGLEWKGSRLPESPAGGSRQKEFMEIHKEPAGNLGSAGRWIPTALSMGVCYWSRSGEPVLLVVGGRDDGSWRGHAGAGVGGGPIDRSGTSTALVLFIDGCLRLGAQRIPRG